jgi:hypothetical protein
VTPDSLAALRRDFPGWRAFRNEEGLYVAWWVGTRPDGLVRAATVSQLREAIEREVTGDEQA